MIRSCPFKHYASLPYCRADNCMTIICGTAGIHYKFVTHTHESFIFHTNSQGQWKRKKKCTEWSYEIPPISCKRNREILPWSPVLACAKTVMLNSDQMLWVIVECGGIMKSGFFSDVLHYFWSPLIPRVFWLMK